MEPTYFVLSTSCTCQNIEMKSRLLLGVKFVGIFEVHLFRLGPWDHY